MGHFCSPFEDRSMTSRRRSLIVKLKTFVSSALCLSLLLFLGTVEFCQVGRRKHFCFFLAHAWQPSSQQPFSRWQHHEKRRRRRRPEPRWFKSSSSSSSSSLRKLAYMDETGPWNGANGNQTESLLASTTVPVLLSWNGQQEKTTLPKENLATTATTTTSTPISLFPPDIGTLGDIMSSATMTTPTLNGRGESDRLAVSPTPFHHSGLVTSSNETLAAKFGITHPLDRMALTANGNLQRLFSSYYDAPVHVHVDYCQPRDAKGIVWDRVVHLTVHDQTFCTATSVITVHDDTCRRLVQSGQVGLGQLFRYLDLLPQFELQQAGRHDVNPNDSGGGGGSGWWRLYELKCRQVHCHIREDFCANLWNIIEPPSNA